MFRIGEFSKIGQVSARQLRRYDEMGLLKPVQVDPFTNYRYYSAAQLPRLNRILALKELGLSLTQIGQFLTDEINSDELRGMLALKRSQVEQHLQEEAARLRYIESRIEQIDRQGSLAPEEVVLKRVAPQPYLAIRDNFPKLLDGFMVMAQMKQTLSDKIAATQMGYYTAVMHSDGLADEVVDIEIGLTLSQTATLDLPPIAGRQLQMSSLPAAEALLTTVRIGAPQTGHGSFAALGIWLETNQYHISGPSREVFLNFPPVGFAHEAVTEIQIPVKKNNAATPHLLG